MKSVILLTIIACSYGAKLNRAYLPPDHAQTSGGTEFLETPIASPIVVADDVVFHKSNAELNELNANHQQTINGFVQVGHHGNTHGYTHNVEDHEEVNHEEQHIDIVEQRPERPQAAIERNAAVLHQDYENDGDHYAYTYETENGIYGEESGKAAHGVLAHGSYSYTGDDGKHYAIRYTADENGFHPEGDHLPTPPPIPEEILKSLEQNARDEAAGIFDDGSYDEEKYGEKVEYVTSNVHPGQQVHSVVVEDHEHAINEENAVITHAAVVPEVAIPRPEFRNPIHENQILVNIPARVVTGNVNKVYLPPLRPIIEDRSSQNGQVVFGTKTHKPSFNVKSGYKY